MNTDKINILFVCKYNVFRSRIAEAYFNKINKNKFIKAKSAGIIASGLASENQRIALKQFGLNLDGKPRGLNVKLLKWQNIIIIVADDIPPIIFNKNKKYGKKIIVWKIKDVKKGEKISRTIRQIMEKVDELNRILNRKDKMQKR